MDSSLRFLTASALEARRKEEEEEEEEQERVLRLSQTLEAPRLARERARELLRKKKGKTEAAEGDTSFSRAPLWILCEPLVSGSPSSSVSGAASCLVSLCCLWSTLDILSTCPLHQAVTFVSAVPKEYRTIGLLWERTSGVFRVLSVLGWSVDTRSRDSLRSIGLYYTHFPRERGMSRP